MEFFKDCSFHIVLKPPGERFDFFSFHLKGVCQVKEWPAGGTVLPQDSVNRSVDKLLHIHCKYKLRPYFFCIPWGVCLLRASFAPFRGRANELIPPWTWRVNSCVTEVEFEETQRGERERGRDSGN